MEDIGLSSALRSSSLIPILGLVMGQMSGVKSNQDKWKERILKEWGETYNMPRKMKKRRRKELKMSQAELAEKVNVSNNHISSIETGKQIPSLTTFVKICEQLDTTPDFLLLGSLHTDNLPKNIYDSLALCNKKDLPLIQDIVENFVSKRE